MIKRISLMFLFYFFILIPAASLDLSGDSLYKAQFMDHESWTSMRPSYPPGQDVGYDQNYLRFEKFASFEFDISEQPREKVLMELLYNQDWVEVLLLSPTGEFLNVQYTGNLFPVSGRYIESPYSVLPLELEETGTYSLLIHVKNSQPVRLAFHFHELNTFISDSSKRQGVMFFLFSIMFLVALINVIYSFINQNNDHLYYGLMMFFLLIALMGKHRFLNAFFFPESPYGYFVYIFFNSLSMMTVLLFCIGFLRIPPDSLRARGIRILSGLFVLFAILSIYISSPRLGDWMNYFIFPSMGAILILIIHSVLKGDIPSRFILLSALPLLISVLIDLSRVYFGMLSEDSSNFVQISGTLIHIVFFNSALSLRQMEKSRVYYKLLDDFHNNVEEHVKLRTSELERSVYLDSLTELLNRKGLEKTLSDLSDNKVKSVGIIFTDLDNFKFFNDSFGHRTGDLIIKELAGFLTGAARSSDRVIRYGGDEFIILLPNADEDTTTLFAHRLHEGFQDFSRRIGINLNIENSLLGLSVGGCIWFDNDEASIYDALDVADQIMLKAKKKGKNKVLMQKREAPVV